MKKVKITAESVLEIVNHIFVQANRELVGENVPERWRGKTVTEAMNIEYYTFKHRPSSTEDVINKMISSGEEVNRLAALDRAFCLFSLGETERLYAKDVDMSVLTANLQYYLQTSKVGLLEGLIEDCVIETSGVRTTVEFAENENTESRKAVVIFGRPVVEEVQTAGSFGEMAVVSVDITLMLYPDVMSYGDYTVSFSFLEGGVSKTEGVPLSSLSFVRTMTQKAMPRTDNVRQVGSVNLSCAMSFVLVFDGYNNAFINHLTDKALGGSADNNEVYTMDIKRGEKTYTHNVVVKDHQVTVSNGTGNETHTLSLVTR